MRNNLAHLPTQTSEVELIRNESADLVSDHNLMTETVWDDFAGMQRPQDDLYDIGAFER